MWIEEGLRALAAGGPDAVRVEALAKALGVTKGGFYGYFTDRGALLTAMLDTWERESTDEVFARIEREGGDARAKIRLAGQLTLSERLLPIDLAVREWARRDDDVAERLRRVDNQRMDLLREMIGVYCPDPDEVEARSLLAFCAAIGSHFLAADHPGGRTRREVVARAADVVLSPMDAAPGPATPAPPGTPLGRRP
nr:TetR/AcrR family transcriptional regulator [Actinocrispum wychmicini]